MKVQVYQFSEKLYELEVPALDLENGAEIFIGRADDCHLVLEDQQVSRHHALLSFENGELYIKKLSDLGTVLVNGNEVGRSSLKDGDQFSITDFVLQVDDLPKSSANSESDLTATFPQEDALAADQSREQALEPSEEATVILNSLEEAPDDEPADEEHVDDPQETSSDFESSPAEESADFSDDSEGEEAFSQEEGFGEENAAFETEEGFGEESADFGGESADFGEVGGGESTQVFQSFAKYYLEIDGERAPFDKYQVEDKEVFIGRDPEKCQIVLNDSEVSSVHAVIRKTLINCFIEDLNSSNGTIYNGERVNKSELANNDNFQIGSTIFTVKITSDLIENEKDMLMPVEDNQEVEVEEVVEEEVDYDQMDPDDENYSLEEVKEKSVIKRVLGDPRKRLYAIVGGLVLVVLLLSGEEDPEQVAKSSNKKTKSEQLKEGKAAPASAENKKQFSPEVLGKLEENYALALAKYEAGEYYEAKEYLEVIRGIDSSYKDTQTLHKLVKQGHEELLRLKAEEEAEKERKKRQLKIQALLKKTKEAVENREVAVAESLFGQILEIDPENMDVPQLKLEIDAYKSEQARIKEEKARKKALRQAMVEALQPGKALFLRED
ncbi:MAG: FHA domain-containing protein, partial [Bacteriovoracaceae bacterium]